MCKGKYLLWISSRSASVPRYPTVSPNSVKEYQLQFRGLPKAEKYILNVEALSIQGVAAPDGGPPHAQQQGPHHAGAAIAVAAAAQQAAGVAAPGPLPPGPLPPGPPPPGPPGPQGAATAAVAIAAAAAAAAAATGRKKIKYTISNDLNKIIPQTEVCCLTFVNVDVDMFAVPMEICLEAYKLHNSDLFNVGGHSHNHLSLGLMSDEDMRYEVDLSISLLNKKAYVSSPHYSYPEGQEIDFNQNVIDYLHAS